VSESQFWEVKPWFDRNGGFKSPATHESKGELEIKQVQVQYSAHTRHGTGAGPRPKNTNCGRSLMSLSPILEELEDNAEEAVDTVHNTHSHERLSDTIDSQPLRGDTYPKNDAFAELSLRAGVECMEKRVGGIRTRVRRDSEPDETSPSETAGNISEGCVPEARKAQTNNMEVNNGVLASSGVPSFAISVPEHGLLQAPGVMVTCPSISSLLMVDSCESSFSIDLSDFPTPPSLIQRISTEIDKSPLFKEDDTKYNQWRWVKGLGMSEKRSTVVQFIMMYGNV
jgi:hypothetical protein